MRRVGAAWLALAALAALGGSCGCSSKPAEGTKRDVRATWESGVVRATGVEVYVDGKWRKEGEFVYFDKDGDETHRGSFHDGLESGVWQERYDDGGVGRGEYLAGKRHGDWTYMHKNGRLAQQGKYEAGKRVGKWKVLSPTGERLPDVDYDGRADAE